MPALLLPLGVLHGAACASAGQLRRANVAGPVGVPAAGRLPPDRADAPFELPMARERGYALVPVGIGGVDSLWFVLDLAAGVRLRADTSRVADLPVFRALGLADRPALILGPHLLEDRVVAVSYSTGRVCFARTAAAPTR